ncbi:hypothetical protein M404DRAFT_560237 [Pisolithus tinctorius Marx 270]|uniref:PITH domain-containing protein n=1 Tax=Pisolithus tinctorius Marx 270 TaxID=870435 RepID=A0A0C3PV29_PISTI|nr:hypothetical protein M404DRAFT_560237 [Pisolithus tinctorius Marx 270]
MNRDNISLLEHLDISQVNCLNEQQQHDLKSIVASRKINPPESSAYLASDADEQLLVNICVGVAFACATRIISDIFILRHVMYHQFNQAVRIRTLVIKTKEEEKGPKNIKLRINNPSISFSDVEDAADNTFSQVVKLSREDVTEGRPIPLRFVRFQSVSSLHIFVESNQGGGDQTRIDAIDVMGIPVETRATKDLSGLKEEEH